MQESSINIKTILMSAVSRLSFISLTSPPPAPPPHLFFSFLYRTVMLAYPSPPLPLLLLLPPSLLFHPLLSEPIRIALSQQEAQPAARTAQLCAFLLARSGLRCSAVLLFLILFFLFFSQLFFKFLLLSFPIRH